MANWSLVAHKNNPTYFQYRLENGKDINWTTDNKSTFRPCLLTHTRVYAPHTDAEYGQYFNHDGKPHHSVTTAASILGGNSRFPSYTCKCVICNFLPSPQICTHQDPDNTLICMTTCRPPCDSPQPKKTALSFPDEIIRRDGGEPLLPERPLMTERSRIGFHGDPILFEEGPFSEKVNSSASSLKLRLHAMAIRLARCNATLMHYLQCGWSESE